MDPANATAGKCANGTDGDRCDNLDEPNQSTLPNTGSENRISKTLVGFAALGIILNDVATGFREKRYDDIFNREEIE